MINTLSDPSYFVPPLIAGVTLAVLLAIALVWSRRDRTTVLFVGLLGSIALRNFMLFAMRSSSTEILALYWERSAVVLAFIGFILFYLFTRVYTGNNTRNPIAYVSYAVLVLTLGLIPTDLIIEGMRIEEYGYAPVMGPMSYLFFAFGPLLIMGGAYNLFKRYRAVSSGDEKKRLLILMIAATIPMAGMTMDGFTNLPPMSIWTDLIFAILCTVAIARYHLLDIQIVIRKSLVYILVSAIAAIPFVGVILAATQVFGSAALKWWIYCLILLFMAIILRPLYAWAQDIVDRMFFRERYDYLRALEEFTWEVHYINDISRICSSLVDLVSRALGCSNVQLILRSTDNHLTIVSSDESSEPDIDIDNLITQKDTTTSLKRLLYRNEFTDTPPSGMVIDKSGNDSNGKHIELVIPIMTKEDDIIGALVLGKKLSQLPYNSEDENLLLTVTGHLATELENASLYQNEKIMRQQLEKQDKMKTEFLNSVAHELNTPLTAMLSSSEILVEDWELESAMKNRLMKNIRDGALIMGRRVKELLDLARSEIGELKLKPETVNVTEIIYESVSQMNILFENKQQKLIIEIPGSIPFINADKDKVRQIIINLLSNANKFSPENGHIAIRARSTDSEISVEVQDSAPVLDQAEINRLFQPYYRGDDEAEREHVPGLGLGLTITRKLVDLHGGRISVKAGNESGNVFSVSLPVSLTVTDKDPSG